MVTSIHLRQHLVDDLVRHLQGTRFPAPVATLSPQVLIRDSILTSRIRPIVEQPGLHTKRTINSSAISTGSPRTAVSESGSVRGLVSTDAGR